MFTTGENPESLTFKLPTPISPTPCYSVNVYGEIDAIGKVSLCSKSIHISAS